MMTETTYETILVETPVASVGLIRLNRPKALNALNGQLTGEMFAAMEAFDADLSISCIVLTGSDRVFAAGADIKQMSEKSMTEIMLDDFTDWSRMTRLGKPIIAAVSGYALGGGSGLMAIGSTKEGAMLSFDAFYGPLGKGASVGESYKSWATRTLEDYFGSWARNVSRAWFYGMTIIGDPTLSLVREGSETEVVAPTAWLEAKTRP